MNPTDGNLTDKTKGNGGNYRDIALNTCLTSLNLYGCYVLATTYAGYFLNIASILKNSPRPKRQASMGKQHNQRDSRRAFSQS